MTRPADQIIRGDSSA